jgi:hypothetical protein
MEDIKKVDTDWDCFLAGECFKVSPTKEEKKQMDVCSDIHISTKTKIVFLNQHVDLKTLFWNIPVMRYSDMNSGVIKKQMKFNSFKEEELEEIESKMKMIRDEGILMFDEYIMTSIKNMDNPSSKIKFKDVRKISIGIRSKDIVNTNQKQKSAFYNCFVLIVRLKNNSDEYKEYHVKIFNTGKMELPGIQDESMFYKVLQFVLDTFNPLVEKPFDYVKMDDGSHIKTETVLINSNFNCGFYIHRDLLYEILCEEYNIPTIYDPCTYPGIQCKLGFSREHGIVFPQKKIAINVDVEEKEEKIGINVEEEEEEKIGINVEEKEKEVKIGINVVEEKIVEEKIGIEEKIVEEKMEKKREKRMKREKFGDYCELSFMIFRTGSVLIVGKCDDDVLQKTYLFLKDLLIREYDRIYINMDKLINSDTVLIQPKKKTNLINKTKRQITV